MKIESSKLRKALFRHRLSPQKLRPVEKRGHNHPLTLKTMLELYRDVDLSTGVMLDQIIRSRAKAYRKAGCLIEFALYQALRDLKEDAEK